MADEPCEMTRNFAMRGIEELFQAPDIGQDRELFDAKEKCFKTLLKVAAVEDDIQFLENEIHGKALQVTATDHKMSLPDASRFDLDTKFHHISKIHSDCVKSVQNNWRWLTSLSKCIPHQVEQAADYHEFFHEADHLEQVLVSWLHWIRKQEMVKETKDPSELQSDIKYLTQNLLQCQHMTEKLVEMSSKVAPLPYRYEMPQHGIVRLKSLITYSCNEFAIHAGDLCVLVDNSNSMAWKVKDVNGVVGEVPPVSMLLDSASSAAVDKSVMLRRQMCVVWDVTRKLQDSRVVDLLKLLTSDEISKLEHFSKDHTNDVLLMLQRAVGNLDLDRLSEETFQLLSDAVESLFARVGYLPSQEDDTDPDMVEETLNKWKSLDGLTNALQDLNTYANHYTGVLANEAATEKLFVPAEEKPVYVSKAFVKKVKTCELQSDPKQPASESHIEPTFSSMAEGPVDSARPSSAAGPAKERKISLTVPHGPNVDEAEIFTKSTMQETTRFRVAGVKDPDAGEYVSLEDAIKAGIVNQQEGTYGSPSSGLPPTPMCEAIAAGDILVENMETLKDFEMMERTPMYSSSNLEDLTLLPAEEEKEETFTITGVMDPKTKKSIRPSQALEQGLIDPERGLYVRKGSSTEEEVPLADAVQSGLLSLERLDSQDSTLEPSPTQPPPRRIRSVNTTSVAKCYSVDDVLDPRTKYRISLKNAVNSGIVDSSGAGCYRNPASGEFMRIQDAMKRGLIKAEPAEQVMGKVRASILQLESLQRTTTTYVVPVEAKKDPNGLAFKALGKHCDMLVKGVKNPSTGKYVSLKDAYAQGILEFDSLEYVYPDGSRIPFEQAVADGLIRSTAAQQLLNGVNNLGLNNSVDNPENLVDPVTKQPLNIQEAIDAEHVDPYSFFLQDPASGQAMTLECALRRGLINPTDAVDGLVLNGNAEPVLTYTKPMRQAFLKERLLSALGDDNVQIENNQNGLKSNIPLDQALDEGVFNPETAALQSTGQNSKPDVSLPEAVDEGLINKEAANSLYKAYDAMSVQRALDNNIMDMSGNCPILAGAGIGDSIDSGVVEPVATTPLSEAIASGRVVPECLFLVDKSDDSLRSLASFIEADQFDPDTCHFNLDGKELTMEEAVAQNYVDLEVKPWRFVPVEAPLIEFLNCRALNERSRLKIDDSRVISVKDGLGSKLVAYQSAVRLGPGMDGVAELVQQGQVLGPLADIPDEIEWLSERELEVAKQAKPCESPTELAVQIESLEAVQQAMEKRAPRMEALLSESQRLLEEKKGEERDEAAEQQYQQLRISAADLKATMDKTHKYLRGQLKKLSSMRGFLDEFYEKQHSFDDWCDTARKQLDKTERQSMDLDHINECLTNYKALQNDITSQETKWLGLQTTGFKFLAEAVEFEKNADVLRQSIHKPLRKSSIKYSVPHVQPETDKSNTKFQGLKDHNQSIQTRVEDNCQRASKFKAIGDEIEEWIPDAEQYLGNQSMAPLAKADAPAIQEAIKELTSLNANLGKHQHSLEDFETLAESLGLSLEEGGEKELSDQVREKPKQLQSRCAAIEEEISKRLQELHNCLVQSQDRDKTLDHLLAWSEKHSKAFKSNEKGDFKVSLNPEQLEDQMTDLRQVEADLKNYVMKLNSLEQDGGDSTVTGKVSPSTASTMDSIKESFAKLFDHVEKRENLLDSYSDRLDTLGDEINALNDWLVETLQSLQQRAAVDEPGTIKAYFDELYRERKNRQVDEEAIKKNTRELVDDPVTCDKRHLLGRQTELATKWHDFTDLLIDLIVMQALRDIEDLETFFLDYEKHHLEDVEPILIESERSGIQLREFRGYHEELTGKKEEAVSIIQKCSKMLRETAGEDCDKSKARIENVRSIISSIWRQSQNRLNKLEEVVPLIHHFNESRTNLEAWLNNITNEVNAIDTLCESTEQIKKQQEAFKASLRFIDEHRPILQDLNIAGQELEQLENESIPRAVSSLNARYDALKSSVRDQINDLAERFRKVTTEVTDALDCILGELTDLNNQIENAEPVAATPDKIKDQIEENNGILEERSKRQEAICSLKDTAHDLIEQVISQFDKIDEEKLKVDVEDIEFKIGEMERLNSAILNKATARSKSLSEALDVARKFWELYKEVVSDLQELQDNVRQQESPQVELELLEDQEKEQQECKESLEQVITKLEAVRRQSESLGPKIGEPGKIEINKNVDDMDDAFEELGEVLEEREIALTAAHENISRFEKDLQAVLAWLPRMEETLANMGPMSLDIRNLSIQIEEVKILKLQLNGKCLAVESLNNQISNFTQKSVKAVDNFIEDVSDINDRWNRIVEGTTEREQQLQDNLIRLGELDVALDDINGYLQQVEDDLNTMDKVYGDPKYLETHLKKLKMVQDDLTNQEGVVRTLNSAITELAERGVSGQSARHTPLLEKQEEMNELWGSVSTLIQDKKNTLQDKLTAVQSYLGDMEDVINWLVDFEQTMKSVKTIGALPETAQKQCEKFNEHLTQLNTKNDHAHALLLAGEDMLQAFASHPFNTVQLRSTLGKLRRSCDIAKKQAKKKKLKLQEHLQNVTGFHSVMKIFKDWLVNGELSLSKFKNPSKLVPSIQEQIKSHRDFHDDVEAHREIVERLDRTGTYLKYYGARNDAVVIRGQLINIKLRWKRLLWKTEERGRILDMARREDERFADSWEDIMNWLDETKEKLNKLAENKASSHRTKEMMDEIKSFELQMSRNHPKYYSTVRLGRNLKDRCTKADPEKEVLNDMVERLKKKWAMLRTEISQKQTQLDEQLLETGRLGEAFKSLSEWTDKAEETFGDSSPVLGDQETVSSLLDHHRSLEEELAKRQAVLNTLQQAADPRDATAVGQLDALTAKFEKVCDLYHRRENRLQDSLKKACDFQDAVNALRDFLPQAENELKFQPLPTDDEEALLALIDEHDAFEAQMNDMVPNVEKIKDIGEQIMAACHPNATRFVKYYLTITHTRWDQLMEKARNRRKRLQEAESVMAENSAKMDELYAWLSEAEVLMITKEDDDIPEELPVVKELLKEHMDFHEELAEKGKVVEHFTSPPVDTNRAQTPKVKSGSTDSLNPRASALQNKWRTVWKMSNDRNKKLHDLMDDIAEMDSVKNFEFEVWRKRYLEWIKNKKFRITDFFRKYEKNEDGTVSKADFISGMMSSKFPTTKAEINAVFNIFDKDRSGTINYKEFIDALRPLTKKPKRTLTESDHIQDEIEREVSQCKCRTQFKFDKVDEKKYRRLSEEVEKLVDKARTQCNCGKTAPFEQVSKDQYMFGESQKLVLVRFLNSTVMVRVGGGWETLHKFLENHDPCKAKGRTNTELREQFLLPDGASQSRATFSSRRKVSSTPTNGDRVSPNPSSASRRHFAARRKVSGSSELLSGDLNRATSSSRRSLSALHRDKMAPAQSMVNLSSTSDYYGSAGDARKRSVTPTTSRTNGAAGFRKKTSTPTPGRGSRP